MMDRDEQDTNWPTRPEQRPGLNAPQAHGNNPGSTPGRSSQPKSWTSHPTQQNLKNGSGTGNADETKETRALPLVDGSSRFARPSSPQPGLGARDAAPPSGARISGSPQPSPRPAASPPPSSAPASRPANDRFAAPAQPQPQPRPTPRREEADNDYGAYGDPTLLYKPSANAHGNPGAANPGAAPRPAPAAPTYAPVPRAKVDPSRSFLQVEIEGEKKRRAGGWILWLLIGIVLLALIGGTAFALAWQGQYAGKIYAGVSALGIDLGGKTPEQAEELLSEKVAAFANEPVTLSWNGKEWKPSLEDLGITIGIDETLDEAFKVGRDADFFGSIADQWTASQGGWQVALPIELSEPRLQAYLDGIAQSEINQELFEGDVRLSGTTIEALPGKEGRSLDTYRTIGMIRDLLPDLTAGETLALPVEVVEPTVSAAEVADVERLLAIRISQPITATTLDKVFTLDQEAIIRFTTIERNPDRTAKEHIKLGWIDRELGVLADNWVADANRDVLNARFAWQNNGVVVLTESVNGFEANKDDVVKSIKEHADKADNRTFSLPGKVLEPVVSSKDLPALGIKDLMGTGTSTFVGSSQERAINIKVAAQLLNGAVVPPGGTFSFLETMGGIDEAHGFVEGYVIAAERTQRGVGGGVCQVSTTMFRSAFFSGMEITERNEHSYRVGWYESNGEPVGFDAAVFDPGVDLKFVNNSPNYVLIEAIAGTDLLTVNIYGTKTAGEVRLEGPVITNRVAAPPDVYEVDGRLPPGTIKQVETARSGLTTTIIRRIITPGQPDKVDEFTSTYRPWPNVYIVASESQIP